MALYELHGTDSRGNDVLLGTGEKAGVALGHLRAAMRTGMPVHGLFVRIDGVVVNETELERRAEEEANA